MQHRIKRWWRTSAIWQTCFAILFGHDVATLDMTKPFDPYNLLETFGAGEKTHVVYPEILPVLTAMLETGLRAVVSEETAVERPDDEKTSNVEMKSDIYSNQIDLDKTFELVSVQTIKNSSGKTSCDKYTSN